MATLNITMRPRTLDEFIGNSILVKAIREKLRWDEKLPVAWSFSGAPGTGKTTLARIIARDMQGTITDEEAKQLDIVEMNASDTNGVDDIREIVRQSAYRPMAGRYKVIILDEAHRLTDAAQNCLLKPCEDRDATTVWIFCTTEPNKLLPAIRRRCFQAALQPLRASEVESLVRRVCDPFDTAILEQIQASKLASPGEIVMAVEKFLAGIPADLAAASIVADPVYADIAKAVLAGDWEEVRGIIGQLRTTDIRGLRAVVASFLKGALLNCPRNRRADALSLSLAGVIKSAAFEDGIVAAGTVGALYEACKLIEAVTT